MTSFRRVAILNRGDAAMRFLRAVWDHNLEHDDDLRTIACVTHPDDASPFAQLSDEICHLGPATTLDDDGVVRSAYTLQSDVVSRIVGAGCDAVWLGWGFASEDADLVARFEAAEITVLGPPSGAIRKLGDKIASKRLAQECGVPLLPWAVLDQSGHTDDLIAAATAVGFPLLIKASAGGGGRGIRRVDDLDGLDVAVAEVAAEVRSSFGSGGLFAERCMSDARHLEVQFVVDADGRAHTLGVRDCTVQRRNQKVIEETPASILTAAETTQLCDATCRLATAAGYRGVGTAEYLFDGAQRTTTFLEVNARLQVEHTVTEMVWGCDLVRAQIDIAAGRPFQLAESARGHAVQARLYAEDPEDRFRPTAGRVQIFQPPAGPNVRVDSGVREGGLVSSHFDPMIAKVIGWGPTRSGAIAVLRRAVAEFDVMIEDGSTNRGLLIELLGRPEFRSSTMTTGWLDSIAGTDGLITPRHERDALVTAAITLARSERLQSLYRFFADVRVGIPRLDPELSSGVMLDLELRGTPHRVEVCHLGDGLWRVRPTTARSGGAVEVRLDSLGPGVSTLHRQGEVKRVLHSHGGTGVSVDVDGSLHRVTTSSSGTVRSPGPSLVVDIAVTVGDAVSVGQRVCTLEAMKTETPLCADVAGIVEAVLCGSGQQVGAGQTLVVVRPEGGEPTDATAETSSLWADPTSNVRGTEPPSGPIVRAIASLFTGFDTTPDEIDLVVETLDRAVIESGADDRWAVLTPLLDRYVIVETLFDRNLLALDDEAAAVSVEAAFFDYCRSHHRGDEAALPEIRPLLGRALALYGVGRLDSSDELRAALWHLSIARSRSDDRRRVATAVCRVIAAMARNGVELDAEVGASLAAVRRISAGADSDLADSAALASLEVRARVASTSGKTEAPPEPVDQSALGLERWSGFSLREVASAAGVVVLRAEGRDDPTDDRVLAFVVVDSGPSNLGEADFGDLDAFEQSFESAIRLLRQMRAERQRSGPRSAWWASLEVVLTAPIVVDRRSLTKWAGRFESLTRGLALQDMTVRTHGPERVEFVFRRRGHARLEIDSRPATDGPIPPRTDRDRRRLAAARLGVTDPWDLIDSVCRGDVAPSAGDDLAGTARFEEHDLDATGTALVRVDRLPAQHRSAMVVGIMTGPVPGHVRPARRVLLANDPLRSLGSLSEAECRRIIAAIDLAEEQDLPVEWITVSSGARIAFDSGTENLDWCAAALKRIVTFTQARGEINVITAGVNVGAQSYWNAEATMLMHTRGILIMVDGSSMVLTGRTALEYSGGVVAEDEVGIGGFERIMGPNGQAQYRARNIGDAYGILLDHYGLAVSGRDERAERSHTDDRPDRDISDSPYGEDNAFANVGEIFDDRTNPGRKRPFAIRPVMSSIVDRDSTPLERFRTMGEAGGAVVWDTRIGGHPVCLIGIESRPTARSGVIPLDGPTQWSGGTLYPHGSRKVARAINAASGTRAVVVLANLSGFDGSPESLRRRQLEYGAEIARAVVNFEGPIVFVVIGRYHGGAYVVFSKQLNEGLVALALEGSFASVIGGAPAAAVAFGAEVRRRVEADPTVVTARASVRDANDEPGRLVASSKRDHVVAEARQRHRAAVAAEFDAIHTVERAVEVGSLDEVIPASRLRPAVIDALSPPGPV